jgi:hypothetical protein
MNKVYTLLNLPLFEKKTGGRWDAQIAEQLPAHLKALFINILNDTNKVVEELKFQKNKHAELFKELVGFPIRDATS